MRLLPKDLRAVLQSIELLTSDLEPESMPVRTDLSVRGLVSADVVSFEAFGNDNDYQGSLWYTPSGSVPNERLQVMADHVHEHALLHDVLLNRRRRGVRLSDYASLTQFKKTVLFNEFFKYLKTDRQLTISLEVTKRLTITVSLCRLRRDFTDRDCAVIELLTPHLETAFRGSQFISEMKRRSITSGTAIAPQIHLVFVAGDLSSYEENQAVSILFARYFGGSGENLPDDLTRYIRHHCKQFGDDRFHLPPEPIYLERPDGTLRIRLSILSASRAIVLLIDETATHLSMPGSGPMVTGREVEVLSWVARGKTDGEIADLLTISTRTVQKHLQNIYQKLGVETRTAAMAKFLEPSTETS